MADPLAQQLAARLLADFQPVPESIIRELAEVVEMATKEWLREMEKGGHIHAR
jgi:hypothetical protein